MTFRDIQVSSLCCLLIFSACSRGSSESPIEIFPGVQKIARIKAPAIRESSGIILSPANTNVFWTHNDKGNDQILYAISGDGALLAAYQVTGAEFSDWEDIAADSDGNLLLADIGNNDAKRDELAVHQIAEPDIKLPNRSVEVTRSWKLRFPDAPFDCESLFVIGTNAYVISKVFNDARAAIYSFPLIESKEPLTLKLVTETEITSPVTGADISRDGSLLGIVAKAGAYVYRIDGDPEHAAGKETHRVKFKDHHIEACTFVSDGLLATAESGEIYLFTDPAFRVDAK